MFNTNLVRSSGYAIGHGTNAPSSSREHITCINDIAAQRKIGAVINFGRGKTIFSDGDDSEYSYKIVEGTVRLSKMMLDGRRQIAEFAMPGDMFGFENGEAYALTAEAVTPVTIIRYHRTHIERLGDEFSGIRQELMAHLRHGWTSAQVHLVMLGRQTAKERVAAFILMLAANRGVKNGQSLDLPMGRQDVADYLGLTIETVCRTLADLKAAHVITIPDRHRIVIRNMEMLETLASDKDDKE